MNILESTIFNEDLPIITYRNEIMEAEILYVLCREIGQENAQESVKFLINTTRNTNIDEIVEIAGLIKCRNKISIVDCFSIASGIFNECPIVFMMEQELTDEIIENINQDYHAEIYRISSDLFIE